MFVKTIKHRKIGKMDYIVYEPGDPVVGVDVVDWREPELGKYTKTEEGYHIPIINIYKTRTGLMIRTAIGTYYLPQDLKSKTLEKYVPRYERMTDSAYRFVRESDKKFSVMTQKRRKFAREIVKFGGLSKSKIYSKLYRAKQLDRVIMFYGKKGDVMANILKEILEEYGWDGKKLIDELMEMYNTTKNDSLKFKIWEKIEKIQAERAIERATNKDFSGFSDDDLNKFKKAE